MRTYLLLIFVAVSMAFATGYFALFLRSSYNITEDDRKNIDGIKRSFQKNISPRQIINLDGIYSNSEKRKLLNPVFSFPQKGFQGDIEYSSSEDCFQEISKFVNFAGTEKAWAWEEIRCGKVRAPSEVFFARPPYIHPSGKSYVFLAMHSGIRKYRDKRWVIKHLPFFHVDELHQVKEEMGNLGEIFNFIEKFDRESLKQLINGAGTILTRDYVWAKLRYPFDIPYMEYRVYLRSDLENFLKGTPYELKEYNPAKRCLYRDGPFCWDYSVGHFLAVINKPTLLILAGLFIIVVLVVRLLIVRIRKQNREDQKRRLALQILSHEFRTPITSMVLTLENIRNNSSDLNEKVQEQFLLLSNDVHRMKRLTEMSKNYLQAKNHKRLIELKNEELDKNYLTDVITEFVSNIADKHNSKIDLNIDLSYEQYCLDMYWVKICLKNLVENSIHHGMEPIHVDVYDENDYLVFKISDEGKCIFGDIKEMCEEFTKGKRSEGSGLGLNIVRKVINDVGGMLTFDPNPTTFKMKLKRMA